MSKDNLKYFAVGFVVWVLYYLIERPDWNAVQSFVYLIASLIGWPLLLSVWFLIVVLRLIF